jgi:hypothetical protein
MMTMMMMTMRGGHENQYYERGAHYRGDTDSI